MGDKTFFLNMAFELAKINLGSTKDNPSVGCIIEKIIPYYHLVLPL